MTKPIIIVKKMSIDCELSVNMISYLDMAMKCSNCGKGIMYGHNVSHSKRRTVKTFKPNLHAARVGVNGMSVKMKLCTKCLRSVKKETREKNTIKVVVAPEVQAPASI